MDNLVDFETKLADDWLIEHYDAINSLQSVVKTVNERREYIGECLKAVGITISINEFLDAPYGPKFYKCSREAKIAKYTETPIKDLNRPKDRHNYQKWWFPLMTYFVETNQYEKFKCMARSRYTRNEYHRLLYVVCKFNPKDLRFIFRCLKGNLFTWEYEPRDQVAVYSQVFDRVPELKRWMMKYKVCDFELDDNKMIVITDLRYFRCNPDDDDDDGIDDRLSVWDDAAEKSLNTIANARVKILKWWKGKRHLLKSKRFRDVHTELENKPGVGVLFFSDFVEFVDSVSKE